MATAFNYKKILVYRVNEEKLIILLLSIDEQKKIVLALSNSDKRI